MLESEIKTSASSSQSDVMQGTNAANTVVDKALEQAGGYGFFQLHAQIAITLGIICGSVWYFSLGYLLQVPEYQCTYLDGMSGECD